jgi:hypothetical protein
MHEPLGESTALACAAGSFRGVAQEVLGEVEGEALLADAGSAVEEESRRESAPIGARAKQLAQSAVPDEWNRRVCLRIGWRHG